MSHSSPSMCSLCTRERYASNSGLFVRDGQSKIKGEPQFTRTANYHAFKKFLDIPRFKGETLVFHKAGTCVGNLPTNVNAHICCFAVSLVAVFALPLCCFAHFWLFGWFAIVVGKNHHLDPFQSIKTNARTHPADSCQIR